MDTIYNRDGCFYRALDDEPVFVLLARDPCTPEAIRWWVTLRQALIGRGEKPMEDHAMLADAIRTAEQAVVWRSDATDPTTYGQTPRWKVEKVSERRLVSRDAVEAEENRHADTIREMQAEIDSLREERDLLLANRPNFTAKPGEALDYDEWRMAERTGMKVGNDFLLWRHDDVLGFFQRQSVDHSDWSYWYPLVGNSLQRRMIETMFNDWERATHLTVDAIKGMLPPPPEWHEQPTHPMSFVRMCEMLDYATVYGEWDEHTPNGTMTALSGEPMNDFRRVGILTWKKALGLLPETYDMPKLPTPTPFIAVDLARKIATGLRQITKDYVPEVNSTTWPHTRKRRMLAYADRISGFAAELEAGAIVGDSLRSRTIGKSPALAMPYEPGTPAEMLERMGETLGDPYEKVAADYRRAAGIEEPTLAETMTRAPTFEDRGPIDSTRYRKGHETDMVDVTEVDLKPHSFAMFDKGREWAYGRGLEINPSHIPAMLDRMEADGWHLVAALGVEASKVGMLFYRREFSAFERAHGFGEPFEPTPVRDTKPVEWPQQRFLGTFEGFGVWIDIKAPDHVQRCMTSLLGQTCGPDGLGRGVEP